MRMSSNKPTVIDFKAALDRRDRAGIKSIAADLIAQNAPIGGQWRAVAQVLQHNGEYTLSNLAVERLVSAQGSTPEILFVQAATLAQTGRLEGALRVLEDVPADVPDPVGNAYLHGTIATNLGRLEEARTHLHRAVDANPASGQSWLSLSALGMRDGDDHYAHRLVDAAPLFNEAPAIERATYFYARGAVLHERGDHEAAFRAFSAGAAAARTLRPYNREADRADAARAIAGYDREYFAGQGKDRGGARPIFVTGLPRSGTTLVEQILASHSQVGGGEELGLFRILEQDVGGRGRGALEAYLQRGGTADALASLYEHLAGERLPAQGRIVDKTLSASRYLGLAATIFPDAPIVWVRRDPMDCAWSCFRTFFIQGLSWSYDPDDIAAHFALEEALFSHWTTVLGDRIMVVDYRDLVTFPEDVLPALLSHCGLGWEPQVLTPHETDRTVVTASVAQVRKPIGRMGLGVAEPYRKWFSPDLAGSREALDRAEDQDKRGSPAGAPVRF